MPMIGRQGKVTGRIGPGLVGEVLIPIRGGAEAFFAYAIDPDTQIAVGSLVVVIEYQAPRTVYVAPAFPAG
jgi:hypothetical protein